MSDEEKPRLKDYQKNYRKAKKLINSIYYFFSKIVKVFFKRLNTYK